jgi:hypothetical protein
MGQAGHNEIDHSERRKLDTEITTNQDWSNAVDLRRRNAELVRRKQAILEVECPPMLSICKLLQRGGYRFPSDLMEDQRCYRPGGSSFASLSALRIDLCMHGVTCKCRSDADRRPALACCCWNVDEKKLIYTWVRCAVVRGPRQSGSVKRMASSPYEFFTQLRCLGFQHFRVSDKYPRVCGYPGVQMTDRIDYVKKFPSFPSLIRALSLYGLPSTCDFTQMTDDERFSVELYLANATSLSDTL